MARTFIRRVSLLTSRRRFPAAVRVTTLSAAVVIGATVISAQQGAKNGQWRYYGGDQGQTHYSPLDQINKDNFSRLEVMWRFKPSNLGDRPDFNMQATPLFVDGTLYFTVALNVTYAVDAVTGKVLWTFDPRSGAHRPRTLRLMNGVSRGLAYDNGRIFVAATDGRLIALDAKSGQLIWQVQTIAAGDRKQSTGAPRVFNGKVIVGNSGADFGTRPA